MSDTETSEVVQISGANPVCSDLWARWAFLYRLLDGWSFFVPTFGRFLYRVLPFLVPKTLLKQVFCFIPMSGLLLCWPLDFFIPTSRYCPFTTTLGMIKGSFNRAPHLILRTVWFYFPKTVWRSSYGFRFPKFLLSLSRPMRMRPVLVPLRLDTTMTNSSIICIA